MGLGKTACAEVFEKSSGRIETYIGPVFEECAIQYLWKETFKGKNKFHTIGRWWGSNPKEKKEEEIDIIALDETNKAFFANVNGKASAQETIFWKTLFVNQNYSRFLQKNVICFFPNQVLPLI
jgi:hypothetical protein